MFDFRYHVASLAAVFLALVLGILVGVAISDPGLADKTSKRQLREQIDRLNRQLDDADTRLEQAQAASVFADKAYAAVMAGRLAGRRIAVVSIGPVGAAWEEAAQGVEDAGGTVIRRWVIELPATPDPIEQALAAKPSLAGYVGERHLGDVGRDLARELVDGGETPLLDVLSTVLLEQRTGKADRPADGVVVVRSAAPERGPLARFLAGFYSGLAGATRAVGVELTGAERSAVPVFRRARLATVDDIDTKPGKVALAVLLADGGRGSYGVKDTADAVLPPIPPVESRG